MNIQNIEKKHTIIQTILLFILIIGTPLLFTSYTRSVFEVNKLLLLRLIILLVYSIWIFFYFIKKDNQLIESENKEIHVLGFSWKKTGLEIPILFWFGSSLLSTLFSENIKVSIIGSYDRWEGIITISNYIMLFWMILKLIREKWQLNWILIGLIGSTTLSAIYGILQSLGIDFMNWSVDPTKRVFACINNPVHFCAYVGMLLPVSLSWLLYMSSQKPQNKLSKIHIGKWIIFISTILIYYSQYLSFSRATWMAFVGAMPLFYLLVTQSFNTKNEKAFIIDTLATGVGIAIFYLTFFFNLHQKGILFSIPIFGGILIYLMYAFLNEFQKSDIDINPKNYDWINFFIIITILLFNYGLNLTHLNRLLLISLNVLLTTYLISYSYRIKGPSKAFLSRLIIILLFAKLQYVAISTTSILEYFSLILCYLFLELKGKESLQREKKYWLLAYLVIFGTIIILPTLPNHLNRYFDLNTQGLIANKSALARVDSYKDDAIKGTARTSMWKSSFPWIKDHFIVGSGLDTIKYMFPVYRRAEYGKLEGGHNYTPDRLHNEYLNTLSTKGLIGFISYYIIFIGSWLLIILRGLYKHQQKPNQYLISGCFAGAFIYLGQVLFNFGVVATLVFFYLLMALATALSLNKGLLDEES